jgi:hypothetical protein
MGRLALNPQAPIGLDGEGASCFKTGQEPPLEIHNRPFAGAPRGHERTQAYRFAKLLEGPAKPVASAITRYAAVLSKDDAWRGRGADRRSVHFNHDKRTTQRLDLRH